MATNVHSVSNGQIKALCDAAVAAKATAYCPYSNFRVGAAILSQTGDIVTGANVENASSPVGICAERCAMGKAVTSGHREFLALAVAADTKTPCSPCGMCRQFLREFCDRDMKVHMCGRDEGCVEVKTLGELLPMSFGPDDLKDGQRKGGGKKKGIPGMD